MRILLLIYIIIMIGIFSSAPNLLVLEPKTWIETPNYVGDPSLSFLFSLDSKFYTLYSLHSNDEFILRKLGHMFVYATLALLLFSNLRRFPLFFRSFFAWLFATAIGFIDEINQYFIMGRDGRVLDVALNSTAALVLVIALIVIKFNVKTKVGHVSKGARKSFIN